MSRSLFVYGCQDETDIEMYNSHSLYRLIGWRIWLPYPLLASKWIQLYDPLLATPTVHSGADAWN